MKMLFRVLLCATLFGSTTTLGSALTCGDPGTTIEVPNICAGYNWSVEMEGLSIGEELLSFTVEVAEGGYFLPVFQVFGYVEDNQGSIGPTVSDFDLFLNGAATPWTEVVTNQEYRYHNFYNQALPAGLTVFSVKFEGPVNTLPGSPYADVRFGDVIPAIPIPAALISLFTGVASLSGFGVALRHRKRQICDANVCSAGLHH